MSNLDNLYRQIIMEHYKNPRNKGLVSDSRYQTLHLKNVSCGDDITIQARVDNGVVTDVHHEGTGCSICCSSASVMSETLKSKTVSQANEIIETYYSMIKGETIKNPEILEEAIVYEGVSKFPARLKCATLAWRAMGAILSKEEGENNG
jgi:SUF system NifU family Fe-S assembly protein